LYADKLAADTAPREAINLSPLVSNCTLIKNVTYESEGYTRFEAITAVSFMYSMFQKELYNGIPNVAVGRFEDVYTYRHATHPSVKVLNGG
jgi:hypothetical protein